MTETKQLRIDEAEFLFGAPDVSTIRKQNLPEFAIVGRSNVGKSSFINRFVGRKLARVSGTPGCTRELNFYRVRGAFAEQKFHFCLVDMPGFGYAKLSKAEREQISRMTVDYLRGREQTRAVAILNDCRRLPEDDELAVQRLCAEEGIHNLVVVTKIDVLTQSEKVQSIKGIANAYRLERDDLVLSGTNLGVEAFWSRLMPLLG